MKKISVIICLAILSLLLIGPVESPPSSAEGPKRVAILPFTMNADRDLSFLQEGIMDMLASRLAWKGEVEVLEKGLVKKQVAQLGGPVDKERAIETGKALRADYVIFGSLTVFGESVSLDARILDVQGSEELMTAFKQTKGMDEVIPTVNQFAIDINEKIMGRVIAPPVVAAVPETPTGPGGLVAVGDDFDGKEVGHVQTLGVMIVGLDVGDVDGDGKNELVVIDRKKVYVYKWREKTFAQFKTADLGWSPDCVYVSVADLDGNGRAEIYVSNLGEANVSSLVLEWDGSGFKERAKGEPWFFRVVDFTGQGQTLIGQRRKTNGSFHGPVQFLKKEGKGFAPTGPLNLPRGSNVFNFVSADFSRSGSPYTALLDRSEYLRLYGPDGKEVWRSESYYGGTLTYMTGGGTTETWYYMPSPIYVTDVDEDGQKEVMICKNESKTRRLLERFRYYSSGALHFLTWDQVGLSTKWTTKKQGGPITGYRVSDVDNDGVQELVVASVLEGEGIIGFGKGRSQVVVYDLK